jgi:hypothetical protein
MMATIVLAVPYPAGAAQPPCTFASNPTVPTFGPLCDPLPRLYDGNVPVLPCPQFFLANSESFGATSSVYWTSAGSTSSTPGSARSRAATASYPGAGSTAISNQRSRPNVRASGNSS